MRGSWLLASNRPIKEMDESKHFCNCHSINISSGNYLLERVRKYFLESLTLDCLSVLKQLLLIHLTNGTQ
uniref:Uncharacterized protein n=1 Tax=Glossina morsitans morsitans TaxID=37546 RepID=A0ABK9NG46_GLOMM